MSAYEDFLNDLTNKNNSLYPEFKNQINWVKYKDSIEKEEEKNTLLTKLEQRINWSFKNTKPWINSLSKGCQICGQGEWSCLFITGKCNAHCFYCPTAQNNDGVPSTQLTSFEHVEDYIQYLQYFEFKGASLSGGEPLVVFERSLHFLKKIRESLGDKIYLWMYTNGLLGSTEIYKQFADAGIDEIRFDIGASNYDLKYIKLAQGIIPNLTVEIPVVPERLEKLKQIIPELIEIGVTNINLHQLRLTNYNAPKLLKRDYTYLHGEQATVLESELTALKIIEFVSDNNFKIGVNYCAFHFKNRFQKAGFRKKIATKFLENNTQLTENGYIRSINSSSHNYSIENNQLKELTQFAAIEAGKSIEITYKELSLDDHLENQLYIQKIIIGNKSFFLRSRLSHSPFIIDKISLQELLKLFESNGDSVPESEKLFSMWKHEFIESGLRYYF